jgi:hypothetical protein
MPVSYEGNLIGWSLENIGFLVGPGKRGIYVIYDSSKKPIYVGQAEDILFRLLEHFNKTSDHSSCIWAHHPRYLQFFPGSGPLDQAEKDMITKLNPPCNKTNQSPLFRPNE